MMAVAVESEDKYIQHIYLFTLCLTLTVVIEGLLNGNFSSIPSSLIGSVIGFSLFWSIEFVDRRSTHRRKTKHILVIIDLFRYAVLGGLLYFLLTSVDIIFAIINSFVYIGTTWYSKKFGDTKRTRNIELFNIASYGLKIVLAICIGYFGGEWIGGKLGNAVIGLYIGSAIGFVVGCIEIFRMEKRRRAISEQAQDNFRATY